MRVEQAKRFNEIEQENRRLGKAMSERWACSVIKQPQSTQRRETVRRDDEDALTQDD